MASSLYGKGRESFLKGEIVSATDNIKVVAVQIAGGTPYTVSIDVDQFLSDVPSGSRILTSGNFATKTTTLGVFDALDITFTAATGNVCGALVIYDDTGTAGTSRLIAYIDTGTNLPFTPNGGDITITWDNGANKIFKL